MSELYPGSYQVKPMKYCGTPPQSAVDLAMSSNDWVAQQKLDGALYMLEKIDDDHIYLFGRIMSKKTGELTEKIANVPHIKNWAKTYMPNNTVFLGEIYVEGGHSNDVTKIMGCLPQKAIDRQEEQGYVSYNIFDCIRWKGEDICGKGFWERYCLIEDYFIELMNDRLNGDELDIVNLLPCYTLQDEANGIQCESFQEQLRKIYAGGGEGAVFKKKDSIYRPNMRTTASQSFKIKEHIDSIDLVIMDILDPEMEYTGKELQTWSYWAVRDNENEEWLPRYEYLEKYITLHDHIQEKAVTKPWYYHWKTALKLGAYNDEGNLVEVCRVASGLTDEIRASLGEYADSYIGTVVEISCMSVNKKDLTVRHPVFVQFRPDKNEKDCLVKDIFGE